MGAFDQAARQAVKLDAAGFFRWLFAGAAGRLVFRGWLDTRRLPFPGDPDRTGDVVAEFDDADLPGEAWGLVLEFQSEPDAAIAERAGLYALYLLVEVRPKGGGRYRVGTAVVNLTGSPAAVVLDLPLPGFPGCGLRVAPLQRNLSEFDAAQTLADIEAGRTARCLLPWIPLMRGGELPDIIAKWKELAGQEPDAGLRAAYAAFALVFAELAGCVVQWRKGLEGWEMRESQVINGWKDEGKLEMRRQTLLELLHERLQEEVPADIQAAVEGTNDPDTLSRWFKVAARVNSLDAFRQAMAAGQ